MYAQYAYMFVCVCAHVYVQTFLELVIIDDKQSELIILFVLLF